MRTLWTVLLAALLAACGSATSNEAVRPEPVNPEGVLNVGFVALDGVYNSELMAPYDVFQHSVYRDSLNYLRTFIVAPTKAPFVTSEGITITPHYSFADAPPIDVLVIPSTETSMTDDLANEAFMTWLADAVEAADWVVTVSDGAFPLAATGHLDGRVATTFPADRAELARRFPAIDVRDDVNFVVDGPYITSVGGALSYEPAFWLVEHLYGPEHAARSAQGLVWNWDADAVPHLVVEQP